MRQGCDLPVGLAGVSQRVSGNRAMARIGGRFDHTQYGCFLLKRIFVERQLLCARNGIFREGVALQVIHDFLVKLHDVGW